MCSNIKLIDQNVEWVKGGAGGVAPVGVAPIGLYTKMGKSRKIWRLVMWDL